MINQTQPVDDSNERWASKVGFLFAAVGFAVGLGNIWRFPYIVGENGGSAFVVIYLFCVFVIGAPILMAELMVGRRGQRSAPRSIEYIAQESGASSNWKWVGVLHLITAFTIMIVYAVVAGWVLRYLAAAFDESFSYLSPNDAQQLFQDLLASPAELYAWTLLALLLMSLILVGGVNRGIERAVKILMPSLFFLMLGLAVYNYFAGGFSETLIYLFSPDFSKVTGAVALAAVGQAFFSIGVAMAGMVSFGAYLDRSVSIPRSAVVIVSADTIVALLAGLVVFPIVFRQGLDVAAGTGLIFETIPSALGSMPGGWLIGIAFFTLLSVAAITSMVGLVEPIIHWAQENFGWRRYKATVLVALSLASLSFFCVLNYSSLSPEVIWGIDINNNLDYLANQIFLPLGGLFLAVFVGWFVAQEPSKAELSFKGAAVFKVWRALMKWLVPMAILSIFLSGIL